MNIVSLSFSNTKVLWDNIKKDHKYPNILEEDSLLDCLNNFFNDTSLKPWKVLSFIRSWGIWININIALFHNKEIPTWVTSFLVQDHFKEYVGCFLVRPGFTCTTQQQTP